MWIGIRKFGVNKIHDVGYRYGGVLYAKDFGIG
jgi:hypothetical protein